MFFDKYVFLCQKKGLSPSKAADEIGFDRSSITKWKNKGFTPRQEILVKIAKYFDVSVDYLLGEKTVSDTIKKPQITESDIKVALFGGDDKDADKKFEDVKRYIEFLNSKKD